MINLQPKTSDLVLIHLKTAFMVKYQNQFGKASHIDQTLCTIIIMIQEVWTLKANSNQVL